MKKTIILLIAALLVVPSFVAHADVVTVNDFLADNADRTELLNRHRFVVNGPDGYTVARTEPGSHEVTGVYWNGLTVSLARTFVLNDRHWGIESQGHGSRNPGWFLMEHVLIEYTMDDFESANVNEFYTYSGNFDAIKAAERLVFWQWPGSDREKRIEYLDFEYDGVRTSYQDSLEYDEWDGYPAYKDNEDREWGKIPVHIWTGRDWYSYDFWICITDPENIDIPAFNAAPDPIVWLPSGELDWETGGTTMWPAVSREEAREIRDMYEENPRLLAESRSRGDSAFDTWIIVLPVLLVVIVGVVILLVIRKKKSSKKIGKS